MRRIWSSCSVAVALTGFTVAGLLGAASLHADEPADFFTVNSVWRGMMEQSNPKSSYPVILFVKQRKGDTFEGMTWYPTLGNGLLKITGRIDAKGTVTFTEDKVLYGEVHGDNLIVVAGPKYTAKLERTALDGAGEWSDPKTNRAFTLKVFLKLAK